MGLGQGDQNRTEVGSASGDPMKQQWLEARQDDGKNWWKKNSFFQKLNIGHLLCYPLMLTIKCQVEKRRTKNLESMRQLWGAANSMQGTQGVPSPDSRDKLGRLWRSTSVLQKKTNPAWKSAEYKAQPSDSRAQHWSLLAAHISHRNTDVAGPGGKGFSWHPVVKILKAKT